MAEENPLPGEPEEKDLQERRSASDAAPDAPNAAERSPRPKDPADPLFRLFASTQESGAARWESKAFEPLPEPTSRILPDAPVRAAQEHAEKASENKTQSQPSEPDFTPEPIVPERLSKTLEMAAIPAPPPAPTPASTPASQRPDEQPLPASAVGVPAPDLHEEPAQHTKLAPVDAAVRTPEGAEGATAAAVVAAASGGVQSSAIPVSAPQPGNAPQTGDAPQPRQIVSLATVSSAQQPLQIPSAVPLGASNVGNSTIIRCRQCGKNAPSELALCPHCGRELKPAPSRWLTIGLPAIVGVLLLALLALQMGNGPLGIVTTPMRALSGWISDLSASLDPQMTVIPAANNPGAIALSDDTGAVGVPPTEAAGEAEDPTFDDVSGASLIGGEEGAPVEEGEGNAEEDALSAAVPDASTPAADAAADSSAPVTVTLPTQTAIPTATIVETPTEAPTNTPEPTPTPMPTETPAPTNTALPATYTVVSGDTALAIAARLGIDLQSLIAYNNMSAAQASMLQPGQVLQIPGGVVSPNTEAGESTYTVRDGDTLVVIAQRNGVTVAQLMSANGLSQSDAFTLRPGQTLIIPGPTPTPSPVATDTPPPTAAATATLAATSAPAATVAPAATSTTAANSASLRVTAPRLRAPISGVSLNCSVEGRLQWNASANIEPADNYRVHLGFVSGRDDAGNLRITWLVEQAVPSTQTSLALDSSLCGTAPDDFGGQWRWYVDVVTDINGTKAPVSTPSEIWGFAWQ